MNDIKIKQQIAEKIKSSSNILVTVSTNPSVDELSAALGLTVMLNKLDKHATAVFSGAIPPAITFLDPEKTFENTVDSLRDFIIALDKEKADHLRYKVEGDVVKIFITPFKTTITSDDLDFSQGDYNVELVLALGVDNQEHLDGALEAHGRILHDATVATITAGEQTSDLGSLAWHDDQASSLSEMLVSLSESIKGDKPLLDEQTATAFLTGIVAATERFSNPRTSSKVMTMAAQLMAAGADQQLIAAKLQESHEIQPQASNESAAIPEGSSVKLEDKTSKKAVNGELSIEHLEGETLEEIAQEVAANNQKEAAVEAEHVLAEQTQPQVDAVPAPQEVVIPEATRGAIAWTPNTNDEPLLGGTLNATTEQAAEDSRNDLADEQNKTILTHSYLGGSQGPGNTAINSSDQAESDGANDVDIFADNPPVGEGTPAESVVDSIVPPVDTPAPTQTLAELDAQTRDHDDARAAVDAALGAQGVMTPPVAPDPFTPPVAPFGLPTPPPLPDFSQLPPPPVQLTSAYALDPQDQPAILGDILAPEPIVPVVPPTPPATQGTDPGQFKIPGQ
jgi:nanoRNase/pAp phosphatase (c-di-AMP/oligoRNAs hydrolase)